MASLTACLLVGTVLDWLHTLTPVLVIMCTRLRPDTLRLNPLTQAEWTLDTVLALPWRPRVSILGSTVYTLSPDGNKVSSSAVQQVFPRAYCISCTIFDVSTGCELLMHSQTTCVQTAVR